MRRNKLFALAFCALLPLVLAACGGGGSAGVIASIGGGVGTGGTGITLGTVTGFGSVLVDGTTYSSATPQYFAGSEQGEATQVSSAALGLGNQLQMQLDAQGNPTTVVIEPELVGVVSQIGSGQFVVNRVTVRVNANAAAGPVTYYSGLTGFASLAFGMQVEVHGAYGVDAQPYIQATLIQQLPSANAVTRISGLVSNLNATAGTFQLGSVRIQLTASTSVLPAGTALANGQWVNVWSNTPPGDSSTLRADVVRVRTLSGVSGPVQIGGVAYLLSGTQFQVSGFRVDASAPTLEPVARGLTPGEYVVVQGQADASAGVLTASSIRTYATQSTQVELSGTITGYVNHGSFLVRGIAVDATQAQFAGGTSAMSLRNGVFVHVLGSVGSANGNVVSAKSVAVGNKAPSGGTVNYEGTVSQFDAANRSFVLTGPLAEGTASALVTLAPNVAYAKGAAAQLVNGANVEIEATNDAGAIVAYSVSFLRTGAPSADPSAGTLETHGRAYAVTATSFVVNGITIQINGVIPQGGSLVNGTKVEVKFTQAGGLNLAQIISVDH